MSDFFKFPTTRYIMVTNEENTRNNKVFTIQEAQELLKHYLIIEEKIDGANLGISFNEQGDLLLQNRGDWIKEPFVGQWKALSSWLDTKTDLLFENLLNDYILFGEWCYATHSIYYNRLPDYFIGFDLYDKRADRFLAVSERNLLLDKMQISIIHQCAEGIFASVDELERCLTQSHYGEVACEGIYIRWNEGKWLKERAKLVRNDFRQNIKTHWSRREFRKNMLGK